VKGGTGKMGIQIHNNLPSELKRIKNFKVFKNKLKSYLIQNCFNSLQEYFLVTMINGSTVIQVSLDMIWKHIDGLWTAILTHVMLCFTWLIFFFFFWLKYILLLYIELLGVVIHGWQATARGYKF
jgi:hypothetical protein